MKGEATASGPSTRAAFARQDLVVTLGTLAMLGALALSSQATMESEGERAVCLSNLRQLTQAWNAFASDNGGTLPGNLDGGQAQSNTSWCMGWLDNASATSDNTNVQLLLNAQVGRYVEDVSIYRCPADRSVAPLTGGRPRVRSVSMNGYMGVRNYPYTAGYRQYRKLSDITAPTPAGAFVFLDEREDSINDTVFQINMAGFSPTIPSAYVIVDYPADYHGRAGSLSFADGHAETWRWLDLRTMPTLRSGRGLPLNIVSPDNPDVARLQAAASRPVN